MHADTVLASKHLGKEAGEMAPSPRACLDCSSRGPEFVWQLIGIYGGAPGGPNASGLGRHLNSHAHT